MTSAIDFRRPDLLPKLPLHSVMVMDNAAFHQRADTGHRLEYLPPYSPDLNPLEHPWAQAKAIRKQTHCSVEFTYYVL